MSTAVLLSLIEDSEHSEAYLSTNSLMASNCCVPLTRLHFHCCISQHNGKPLSAQLCLKRLKDLWWLRTIFHTLCFSKPIRTTCT